MPSIAPARQGFAFAPLYRLPALAFGVTPRTAWVDLDAGGVRVRFGPWRLRTTLGNITSAERSGGFAFVKTRAPIDVTLPDDESAG